MGVPRVGDHTEKRYRKVGGGRNEGSKSSWGGGGGRGRGMGSPPPSNFRPGLLHHCISSF
jgi:hypothetical protein